MLSTMAATDIMSLSQAENRAHANFFGRTFNLDVFRSFLGRVDPENLAEWLRLGLGPHFLPAVDLWNGDGYADFPGWKQKPGEWFFKQAMAGNLHYRTDERRLAFDTHPLNLGGRVVLVDIRARPSLDGPNRDFKKDNLLGPIIQTLRRKGMLKSYPGRCKRSRFGISPEEWITTVPVLADFLCVEDEQVQLERVVEANVIPQLYPHMPRCADFQAGSYVMTAECAHRVEQLSMGDELGKAGTSFVHLTRKDHWLPCAVRPIIILEEA